MARRLELWRTKQIARTALFRAIRLMVNRQRPVALFSCSYGRTGRLQRRPVRPCGMTDVRSQSGPQHAWISQAKRREQRDDHLHEQAIQA